MQFFQQLTAAMRLACRVNAGITENIYNGCRTSAAAEASYDRTPSLAL